MLGEAVHIDPSSTRASFSDQPVPPGAATRMLRQAAEAAGLDPVAELYNEALQFTTEGQVKDAQKRLEILLGLAPEDGEARLLLAKVLCVGQRWTEALAALDEAEAAGMDVPVTLRSAIEEHLRADRLAEDEQRLTRSDREQVEVKNLRQEARRLRSDHAHLLGRVHELEGETRKWAWATSVVSGLFIVFLLGNLVFGGGSAAPETDPAVASDAATAPVDGAVPADAAAPAPVVAPVDVADRVFALFQSTAGLNQLTVELLEGNAVQLTGSVPMASDLRRAKELASGVEGVSSVADGGVTVLARTTGTTYTVQSGDNLGAIALKHYGSATLSARILAANSRTLRSERNLQVGQELVIPPVE
jgi:nucleoid-associated protein YgaU